MQMHLSSLSPFGPIFGMELRTASRRKRNYLLRVGYLGALLLFLLFAYGITSEWGPSGVAARARQQEALGWAFFLCFSLFSVSAMALIGPVLTSTAISGERLHKTFHVLLMTPINAWQIAAGKLFSRLLTALVLIGLSLPVLALVRLLGGVELGDMFGLVILATVTCMATAALGLLYSTLFNRTFVVILLSFATLLLVYVFLPFMMQLLLIALMRNGGPPPRWVFGWFRILCAMNPPLCTGMMVSGGARFFGLTWIPCIVVHLVATAVLLFITGILLRRLARREGEGASPAPTVLPMPVAQPVAATDLATGPQAAPDPVFPPPAQVTRKVRAAVSDNPVLWREIRKPLLPKRWQRWTLAAAILGLLLFTYWGLAAAEGLDDKETHVGYAWVFHTLLLLVVCVLSGTAIAQEKESDTWTVLLASPTSARDILYGKLGGILMRLGWPMALITVHFMIFSIGNVIAFSAALVTLWVMLTFNSVWLATGLYLSLRFAKVTSAVIVNLLLPLLFYGGFTLILLTIEGWFRIHDFGETAFYYLPYFYMGVPLRHFGESGTTTVALPGVNNTGTPDVFIGMAFVAGLFHLLIAAGILLYTATRFNQIVGRASQQYDIQPHGMGLET